MRQAGRDAIAALDHLARAVAVVTRQPLSSAARRQFGQYLDLFVSWNRVQRMTAFESPAEIVRGLFLDSVLFYRLIPTSPLRLVDIGAGAGIPGLPLTIIDPAVSVTLIESRRKRASFLKAVKRELDLERVSIFEGRAESLDREIVKGEGEFDAVIARAVAPVSELIPVALRYLKPGGKLIVSGPPSGHREKDHRKPADLEIHEYPELGVARAFWVVIK